MRPVAIALLWCLAFPAISQAFDLGADLTAKICADTGPERVPMSGEAWGCYDALPGHPTREERKAFIGLISPAAQEAERRHGPPAPALVAMALLESGAGFTRMAICSGNLYGFKWTSPRQSDRMLTIRAAQIMNSRSFPPDTCH